MILIYFLRFNYVYVCESVLWVQMRLEARDLGLYLELEL